MSDRESDYTPTTDDVREAYSREVEGPLPTFSGSHEFDRWLAAHDAEIARAAMLMLVAEQANGREVRPGLVAEEPEWEYGWHTGSTVSLIGRRDQVEEWLAVRGWKLGEGDWGSRVMRRRVAGSWMPAEQDGAET